MKIVVVISLLVYIIALWASIGAAGRKNDAMLDSLDLHRILRRHIIDSIISILPDAVKAFMEKNTKYLRLPVKLLTLGIVELRP